MLELLLLQGLLLLLLLLLLVLLLLHCLKSSLLLGDLRWKCTTRCRRLHRSCLRREEVDSATEERDNTHNWVFLP